MWELTGNIKFNIDSKNVEDKWIALGFFYEHYLKKLEWFGHLETSPRCSSSQMANEGLIDSAY